jgi:uncharacterized membrane protein
MILTNTLIKYCSLFFHSIDKNGVRLFLESSPQYPNLLSVIQTLQYVGLDAQAGQCGWEYLKNLDAPFLLHLKSNNHENLVIAKWDGKLNALKYHNLKEKRWIVKGENDFRDYWDGIVIYTNNHQISKCAINLKSFALYLILGISLLSIVCFYALKINPIYYTPIFLGCVISGYLYFKTEMSSSLIDGLCHISKVTDCERVESSPYSSLFGFSMSCLAFSFFASQLISLGIGCIIGTADVLNSLYFISAVVLIPIMAYSVYGQFKVKNICPLCILVLLCIATEDIIYLGWPHLLPSNLNIIIIYTGIFLIASSGLQYIHNIKKNETAYLRNYIDLLKLKRKDAILQSESTPIKTTKTPISFGEKDSASVVTTLISPNCSHCRKMVYEFLKLQKKGVKFKWNIILGQTSPNDSEIIDNWILRYYSDKDKFFEELYRWSNKTIAQISHPPLKMSIDNINILEVKQSFERAITEMNIIGFPRIIFNDRLLSRIYVATDLEFLIEDKNIIQ